MIIDWCVIPHKEQRYPTVGDWWWDPEVSGLCMPFVTGDLPLNATVLHIRVSKMSNPKYEWLVGIHEVIEVLLCGWAKIKPSAIDYFDTEYEKTRGKRKHAPCGCKHYEECGDDPHAPYHRQHSIASVCERALGVFLGVNWGEYDREVQSL